MTKGDKEKSKRMKVALEQFNNESDNILLQLEKYHCATQNQIINTFKRLFDNLPKEIMSTPISQCQQQYLKLISKTGEILVTSINHNHPSSNNNNNNDDDVENIEHFDDKKTDFTKPTTTTPAPPPTTAENNNYKKHKESNDNNLDIIEQSATNLIEFESHLKNTHLTSTVKKLVTTKSLFLNHGKNSDCIDESIIAEENTIDNTMNVDVSIDNDKQKENKKREYPLDSMKLEFKLKNGHKESITLNKLNDYNLSNINDDQAVIIKKIRLALFDKI